MGPLGMLMSMRLTGGREGAGGASSVEGERIRLIKLQRPPTLGAERDRVRGAAPT
jgi:hypothetical protein